MKLNKKGFTLIELLVTIVIVGLVIALSTYGITQILKNAENQKNILSVSSIKEAARIYSGGADSVSWKDGNDYNVFCVTIGELMNKGLLEKNADIENNFTKDNFVVVKRNKITHVIEKEEFAVKDDSNYNFCINQIIIPSENIIKAPAISNSISYTDKIEISFNEGSAAYNGTPSETNYRCLYGTSSSIVNREGIIEGNKCILNGLEKNTQYYAIVYMDTSHGSTVPSELKEISTTDFVGTEIRQDQNPEFIYITFSDIDNYSTSINSPSYYFKSTINAESDEDLYQCSLDNNDIFTCSDVATKNAVQNVWYKTNDKIVTSTYPLESNKINITARIYDSSNNYKEDSNNFEINKYTIKFHKNNAESIGDGTSEVIERTCVTRANELCSILSPTIKAPLGYEVVGWNTNTEATTSIWDVNSSKNVNFSGDYYAIIKKGYYIITYDANGDNVTNVPSAEKVSIGNSVNLSETIPIRNSYIFTSWNTSADGNGTLYKPGSLYIQSENIILYAQWEEHTNHIWEATGNTLFTLYEPAKFTCPYYHMHGYARYCSICGMSVRYYREYVNQSSKAANWWCPCEIVSSNYTIFNDSELYSSNAATGRSNVENRCGLTCGEGLFDTAPTLTRDCTEHITDNLASNRDGTTT